MEFARDHEWGFVARCWPDGNTFFHFRGDPSVASSRRILLIDGDHAARLSLSQALHQRGFVTLESADAWTAIEALPAWRPDLIVLDWHASDTRRSAALDSLKQQSSSRDVPIMLISCDDSEDARVSGLQRGGDDYVVKPFSLPEVMARINALLRRTNTPPEVIEIDGLTVDASNYTATTTKGSVRLRPAEFRLLRHFMRHPDRVHTRLQLLNSVWHARDGMGERSVDVHIRRLRQALDEAGHCGRIQTVRGVGYRFPSDCDC